MYQREGRTVHMLSLQYKFTILPGSTYPNPGDRLKLALVWDKSPNGNPPVISDIFQDVDQTGVVKTDPESNLNLNNRGRFRILRHWYKIVPVLQSSSSSPQVLNHDQENLTMEGYLNWRTDPKVAVFKDGLGVSGSIHEGALYCVALSANSTTAAPTWQLFYSFRLRYTG